MNEPRREAIIQWPWNRLAAQEAMEVRTVIASRPARRVQHRHFRAPQLLRGRPADRQGSDAVRGGHDLVAVAQEQGQQMSWPVKHYSLATFLFLVVAEAVIKWLV